MSDLTPARRAEMPTLAASLTDGTHDVRTRREAAFWMRDALAALDEKDADIGLVNELLVAASRQREEQRDRADAAEATVATQAKEIARLTAREFNRAEKVTRLTEELEDSRHALATTSTGLTRHIQRWQALKEWAGKPDTSIDVGAHGLPEVKRIIRELEAQS